MGGLPSVKLGAQWAPAGAMHPGTCVSLHQNALEHLMSSAPTVSREANTGQHGRPQASWSAEALDPASARWDGRTHSSTRPCTRVLACALTGTHNLKWDKCYHCGWGMQYSCYGNLLSSADVSLSCVLRCMCGPHSSLSTSQSTGAESETGGKVTIV